VPPGKTGKVSIDIHRHPAGIKLPANKLVWFCPLCQKREPTVLVFIIYHRAIKGLNEVLLTDQRT